MLCVSSFVATAWRMGHAVPAQDSFCGFCCLLLQYMLLGALTGRGKQH
jgi:hypothetical protein